MTIVSETVTNSTKSKTVAEKPSFRDFFRPEARVDMFSDVSDAFSVSLSSPVFSEISERGSLSVSEPLFSFVIGNCTSLSL